MHGLPTYVAMPEGTPKGVVVFITDAFGWDFVNSRVLCDIYAKKGGFIVYCPDIMMGMSLTQCYSITIADTAHRQCEVFRRRIAAHERIDDTSTLAHYHLLQASARRTSHVFPSPLVHFHSPRHLQAAYLQMDHRTPHLALTISDLLLEDWCGRHLLRRPVRLRALPRYTFVAGTQTRITSQCCVDTAAG